MHDALPNHIVVAVVVVERALVVGRRTPRLVGDRLQQDVVAETLRHQAINQSIDQYSFIAARRNAGQQLEAKRQYMGEVTSQNLCPRYNCRVVGMTWHNLWSWRATISIKFNRLIYDNVRVIINLLTERI